eukprot:764848-Pelagomonas_calceolata.AAC.1
MVCSDCSCFSFPVICWLEQDAFATRGCYCWSCCCDGRAGEGVEGGCAVAFRLVGVAGTTPVLGGIVDTAGACPAGTAAAVCVGGGAGNH